MTREEAVEILTRLEINNFRSRSGKTYLTEALTMAVNALRTEPGEDAISRSELLKAIDTWDKFGFEHTGCFVREPKDDFVTYVHYDDVVKCIKGMPSVQPEQKWVPVSERLPIKGTQVLCCNKYGSVFTSELTWSKGYLMFGQHSNVIACMPLPEPFKPQESEE